MKCPHTLWAVNQWVDTDVWGHKVSQFSFISFS